MSRNRSLRRAHALVAATSLAAGLLAAVATAPPAHAATTVSVTVPPVDGDNGWYRAQPTFTVNASDTVGITSVKAAFTGAATNIVNSPKPSPYPTATSATAQPNRMGVSNITGSAVNTAALTTTGSPIEFKWDGELPWSPIEAHWDDLLAGQDEPSTSSQACAVWDQNGLWPAEDAVSGMRDYRVQVAENTSFTPVVVERVVDAQTFTTCFGTADGLQPGHSYYFRVASRDQAGNEAWSLPSNRLDYSQQRTGPVVVHAPIPSAVVGRPVTVTATSSCDNPGFCSARVFYKQTGTESMGSPLANAYFDWIRVEMTQTGIRPLANGTNAVDWTAEIPGGAMTSTGVDYYLQAEDTFALTNYPGLTYADAPTGGVQPIASAYFHIHAVSPPVPAHTPPPFGQSGRPLGLDLQSTCSEDDCTATLYYQTSSSNAAAETWTQLVMTETARTALPEGGDLITYHADVPASAVDTRGVDYAFHVTDGATQAWAPGTTYEGYYIPLDGRRLAHYHTHVLEPPHVVHAPVPATGYRQSFAVEAQSTCAATCTGTLYYRTSTSGLTDPNAVFLSAPMTVAGVAQHDGQQVVTLRGTVPPEVIDTRGVDYYFSVTDGATTTWWPGTSAVDGYVRSDGIRVGWHHVRVLERPHFAHVPTAVSPRDADLAIETQLTCATESCTATLHYATWSGTTYTDVPMTRVSAETATPLGRVATYRGVIPAVDVTTAGIKYHMDAWDGYVATSESGAGASVDTPVGPVGTSAVVAHYVRVLEPPHVVHAPQAVSYYKVAIPLEARSNCATGNCVATLHWRTSGHPWQQATMAAAPPIPGAVVGDVWTFTAAIPAADATTEGVDYWIEVDDGYVKDTTQTFHVTVLAPTAILHQPTLTSYPGRPITIDAVVPCSTPTCTVTLSYRVTGAGLLAEPAWTTATMHRAGAATAVGQATSVSHYVATIPADVVTTKGVDYFIHATDGHTNAYSPGTAYSATQATRVDGMRTHFFHVHVVEPVRMVHQPTLHAYPAQPIPLTATVNCATRACTATMSYRRTAGITTAFGLLDYVNGGPAFTDVPMTEEVVQDLGESGTVLRYSATIPADAVTTDGLDYYLHVTDGSTNAWYPGTSYVGGWGSADGIRAAHQHVEVFVRPQVAHAPPATYQRGKDLPISGQVLVHSHHPPTATLWYAHSVDATFSPSPMVLKLAPVQRPEGTLYTISGAIPAAFTAEGGTLEYYIAVDDGYQKTFAPLTVGQNVTTRPLGFLVLATATPL